MTNEMNLHEGPAGARDLILECQELLLGLRTQLTPLAQYKAERLRTWRRGPSVVAEDLSRAA